MKQIYHQYQDWEDYKSGMWRKLDSKDEPFMLDEAIRFTGNHQEYGAWMMKVAKEWTTSCEHNLTDISQNRRAWIGHAAASMAIGCPEYLTRLAWGFLTDKQRHDANSVADIAIEWWERNKQKDGYYAQELFGY